MTSSLNITGKDHIHGKEGASIELVEYGDFQCPYCRKAYFIVKEIEKELGSNLKYVFRNFPLTELHPNALNSAITAEIAGGKGKFWQMHDILFENQKHLEDSDLLEYAKKVGISETDFREEFDDDMYYNKIREDYNSGVKYNVEGTPTFFINGQKFDGNWMDSEFIDYIKAFVK